MIATKDRIPVRCSGYIERRGISGVAMPKTGANSLVEVGVRQFRMVPRQRARLTSQANTLSDSIVFNLSATLNAGWP